MKKSFISGNYSTTISHYAHRPEKSLSLTGKPTPDTNSEVFPGHKGSSIEGLSGTKNTGGKSLKEADDDEKEKS